VKQEILSLLRFGRENVITGKRLAEAMGQKNDRQIRMIIRDLIAEGHVIASTTEAPAGYFIASTREEVDRYLKDMKSRLVNDAYRRRDFKKAAYNLLNPPPGQLSFDEVLNGTEEDKLLAGTLNISVGQVQEERRKLMVTSVSRVIKKGLEEEWLRGHMAIMHPGGQLCDCGK